MGKQKSQEIIVDSVDYNGIRAPFEATITRYEYVNKQPFDECIDSYGEFYSYSLSEVYHLLMNYSYQELGDYTYPVFRSKEGSKFILEGAGTLDFELSKVLNEKKILLDVSSCN